MLLNIPPYLFGAFVLWGKAAATNMPPTDDPLPTDNDGIIEFSTLANGDVAFSLPQLLANDLSSSLHQIACQSDPGPDPFSKRQLAQNYPCAVQNAKIAMKSIPLKSKSYNSLLLTPPLFPILKSGLTNAINQIYSYSVAQPQWAPKYVNDTQLTTISTVIFVLAANHEYNPGQSIVVNTIPVADIGTAASPPTTVVPSSTQASATTTGNGRCPTVSFVSPTPTVVAACCNLKGCNGNGIVCGEGPYVNCPCYPIYDVDDGDSIISPQQWDANQAYLASVQAYDGPLSVDPSTQTTLVAMTQSTTAPASSSSGSSRTCALDCGSELPAVCYCHCSDGTQWRVTNFSPPCK